MDPALAENVVQTKESAGLNESDYFRKIAVTLLNLLNQFGELLEKFYGQLLPMFLAGYVIACQRRFVCSIRVASVIYSLKMDPRRVSVKDGLSADYCLLQVEEISVPDDLLETGQEAHCGLFSIL